MVISNLCPYLGNKLAEMGLCMKSLIFFGYRPTRSRLAFCPVQVSPTFSKSRITYVNRSSRKRLLSNISKHRVSACLSPVSKHAKVCRMITLVPPLRRQRLIVNFLHFSQASNSIPHLFVWRPGLSPYPSCELSHAVLDIYYWAKYSFRSWLVTLRYETRWLSFIYSALSGDCGLLPLIVFIISPCCLRFILINNPCFAQR